MTFRFRRLLQGSAVLGAVAALGVAAALHLLRPDEAGGRAAAAAPPQAVPVAVRTLEPRKVRAWSAFSGRLHAVDAAEIRPEVGGRITEVLFEDGQNVEAGDILFVIDPRPYQAAVARAEAALASARANVAFTKTDLGRAAALVGKHAVSQRFYDERSNAARVAEAAVETAQAELDQARLDLEHAYVRAPISGRAGRVELTVGNLVAAGPSAPLLTSVVADKAVYADFEVDEQTYLDSIREQAVGRAAEREVPVELSVGEAGGRVYRGHIYSFDNRIDPASGTIRARARFDNADGTLLPGMFVTVRLGDAAEREALLLPERAIGFDQSKTFVYLVDGAGKVAYREVSLGRQIGAGRVVRRGLEPGDRVIVDGLQHVRPEMLVAASEAPAPAAAQQAAAAN
ncbi:membrane fusion protein, multidrug efflux system [Tistlia consotensis]|uniref:Membrane fusion protein, multidrug efflux system n=1 Tax=Tistlia consotensis USBA 355 TaxID=560819 RepID=A0A1Y6CHY5_9PROT|nr:efflux RND transporter periplasmic adaptor subunit [Tistlia consotensis]SMF55431.1 membrane fusion protein, multidrug efflux system [Tistlia consotensis USBA 355]SNR88415.1 membrane fusion protein, multidrug efflux system [Tistlia consotensis]